MNQICKEILQPFNINCYFPQCTNENVLFFDIETTGFSPVCSQLYLIGLIYFKDGKWIFEQLFAENDSEQIDLLTIFFEKCRSFQYIIHFNGDTFDLPYIQKKSKLLNVPCSLDHMNSIDLLKIVRPFQKVLGLENCKLKTIEKWLGIDREDQYTGGELIEHYHMYCQKNDTVLKNNLLLHNEEDLYALMDLLKIRDAIGFLERIISNSFSMIINDVKLKDENLFFSIHLNQPAPFNQQWELGSCICELNKNTIDFKIEVFNGTLYHFFTNYKDYYYLPDLNEAVHKSVGQFITSQKKIRAKASNCYIKKTGIYMPVWSEFNDIPVFQLSYKSKTKYASVDDISTSSENLISFVQGFFKTIIKEF